jgi:uncharacterized low-complexity protein
MIEKGQPMAPIVLVRRSPASITMRFWIETIALVGAIACALALGIATLGAVAGAATEPESGQSGTPSAITLQSYEGVITDGHCGAKHSALIGKTAADCTRACVHGGEQFVLVDGDTVYVLEGDRDALKRAAGRRVKIVGKLDGKTIAVNSIVV